MLQYAIPNIPQPFQRPPSAFADSLQRRQSTSTPSDLSIPRPPSTLSHQSSGTLDQSSSTSREGFDPAGTQPALSTLAFLAANAPALVKSSSTSGDSTRSSTPASSANMSTQYAPAATPGGSAQTVPPVCANCSTGTTPLWRRDESGSVLCNACGLFLKLHGRPRPISLKTDVIKSRNRAKTSQPRKRDSTGGQDSIAHTNGYPAAHPDAAGLQQGTPHGLPLGTSADHSGNPTANGNGVTPPNASHQIFDTVSLPSDAFPSPSLPAYSLQQPSPNPSTLNNHTNMDPPHNYETIVSQNNTLRTRVSELEVINDLFRGRVAELEASEQEARRTERMKTEEAQRLNAELQAANARAAEVERRLAELEAGNESGPARKRQKLDDNNSEREGLVQAILQHWA